MADPISALSGVGDYEAIGNLLGISTTATMILVVLLSVWILTWKGLALWKAAGKKSVPWFVILLIINTVGILEILYIFVFSKISFNKKEKKKR